MLKANKGDGDIGLISDMIIKVPDTWLEALAALVTSMFNHGCYPEIFRTSTITSLIKDMIR